MSKYLIKNKSLFQNLRRSSGQSMMDTMLIVLLLGLIVAGYGHVSTGLKKTSKNRTAKMTAGVARMKVISYFDDASAWTATYNSITAGVDGALPAIIPNPIVPNIVFNSAAARAVNLKLYIPAGTPIAWSVWDTSVNSSGFTENGDPCANYPSQTCVFRYEFKMRFYPQEPTNGPKDLVEIQGILKSRLINSDRFGFTVYKNKPI